MSDLLERLFAFAEQNERVFVSAESYLGYEIPYFPIFNPDGSYDYTYAQAGPPIEGPSNYESQAKKSLSLYDYAPPHNSGGTESMTNNQFHEWERQTYGILEEERPRPPQDSQPRLEDAHFDDYNGFEDGLGYDTCRAIPPDYPRSQERKIKAGTTEATPTLRARLPPPCIKKEEDAAVKVPWPTVDVVERDHSPPYTPLPLAPDALPKSMDEAPLASKVGSRKLRVIHPSSELTDTLNSAQSQPDEGMDMLIAKSKVTERDSSYQENPRKKKKADDGDDPKDLDYTADSPPSAMQSKRTRRKKGNRKEGPNPVPCGNGLWRCLFGCTKSDGTFQTFTREFDAKRHMDWSCKHRLGQAEGQAGPECPVCHYKLSRIDCVLRHLRTACESLPGDREKQSPIKAAGKKRKRTVKDNGPSGEYSLQSPATKKARGWPRD